MEAIARMSNGNGSAALDAAALSARSAGLRYVTDAAPGIKRVRAGSGFRYVGPRGEPVRDPETLWRIKRLAIPPAWKDVWICPSENGHLQAVGRDARGRKQYRYHASWRETRDETKYQKMIAFARALSSIRARVAEDLARPGLPREKILATVARLLETTLVRVGNEEYARENGSYGLTTMRSRHVEVSGPTLRFEFRGKSGRRHTIGLTDPKLAKIVKACRDLPGQELFQYVDESGERRAVDSSDVNDYIRGIAGEEFTAKDFRTWAGTVLAARALSLIGPCGSEREGKRNVTRAVEAVAARLGNTVAVSRKCYIHPALIGAYLAGRAPRMGAGVRRQSGKGATALSTDETRVLRFLQRLERVRSKSKPPRPVRIAAVGATP